MSSDRGDSDLEEELGKSEFLYMRFLNLAHSGRLTKAVYFPDKLDLKVQEVDLTGEDFSNMDLEDLFKIFVSKYYHEDKHCDRIRINTTPFELGIYSGSMCDSAKQFNEKTEQMRLKIKELGFKLTDKEERLWDSFMKQRLDNE